MPDDAAEGEGAFPELDLAAIVGGMREGVQVISPRYEYLYVNEAAALHGRASIEALVGRTMMELYPGIEHSEMFAHLTRVLNEGGTHRMENEFQFPDGGTGWFELRISRVPAGAVILSIDVTDRKDLEMRVRRAQRMDAVGQLAGGIAHDFNNLLTIIHNYGTFVQEGLAESDPLRDDVDCVLEATRRGAELTKKLLSFARQAPLAPQIVEVSPALEEIHRLLSRVLGEDVVLSTLVDPDIGAVRMDRSAFDQILVNLAINGRDAMIGGGSLTIEAQPAILGPEWAGTHAVRLPPGDYVVISVTDTGSGIPREHLERIFDPFFTTKENGTGLGLATCWGLVEQAGGALTVYSELDTGTTFRMYLPTTDAADTAARASPPPAAARGERVLVVEDEDMVRALLARVLREHGYKVVEAATAAEALLLVEDIGDELDLLVTDVIMPRMSGVELADRIRRRFPQMRALFVSGFAPRSLERRGLGDEDLPVLTKPFTPDSLLRAVRSVLGQDSPERS